MSFSFFGYVGNPAEDGLINSTLLSYIEVISTKDFIEFLHRELQELFMGNNLLKVISDIAVGFALQLRTEADFCELPDADAVLWAELLTEEVGAGLYDIHYIEHIGC